ncbi:putative leucine-rich repeat protein [Leptomonas pyrrhocoris]|uniref:Putative leucine-rich repeat protein n=1 Tax=Leptomonas pyrrhocoris TaxID=157538 RepID=A0A0N1J4E7_LEPPY|nr:putative leucine-rich repeat protein [Leptomonas pyrrhocoris]KPA75824.1 putative leucine-rich repeat protein [Leptomonas pyrrhocoris]|eukprot:XP_015654263.1 putative leucine-rich repeat protein [Leptomonas pyrrhocoris]
MNGHNVEPTSAAAPQNGPSSSSTAASIDVAVSSRHANPNARQRTSAGSAETRRTTNGAPAATVPPRHRDPTTESSHSAAAFAVEGNSASSAAQPLATSTPPSPRRVRQQEQWQQVRSGKTIMKARRQAPARHAGKTQRTNSPVSTSQASPDALQPPSDSAAGSEGFSNGLLGAAVTAPSPRMDDVVCVVLPEAPSRFTPRVSAAAKGGRLDLRARGLTVLPCLHLAGEDTAAAHRSSDDGAGSPHSDVVTCVSSHGSGDTSAVYLHAVNLRQNRIRSLLTPSPRSNTTDGPRSTPLPFYAHVSSLDLTHNELTSIAGVEALRCLRSLRLAFNKLTSLAPLWASPYVAELDVLDVSSNALSELMTAEDVRALELHRIRIVTHPTQAKATTGGHRSTKTTTTYKSMRLRVLYAANNALRSVPCSIYTLSHLADLRLCRNEIESVPESFPSRACLPMLARLDLSVNCLPPAVVEAITARVEGAAEASHARRGTPPPYGDERPGSTNDNSSRRFSGSSARRVQQPDGAPTSSFAADQPVAAMEAAAGKAQSGGVIQLMISHNAVRGESGSGAEQSRVNTQHSQSLLPREAAVATPARPVVKAPSPPREQRPRPPLPDATASAGKSVVVTAAAAPTPASSEPHRPSVKREEKPTTAGADRPSLDEREEKPSAASSPPSAATVAAAAAPSNCVESAADNRCAPGTAADAIATFESAVETSGENVYVVNVQRWAATMQHNLSCVMKTAAAAAATTADADDAPVQFTEQELLTALYDNVGGCMTAAASSSTGGAAATAGASKSIRPRVSSASRVIASLLHRLPPVNSLCFPEDTQLRAPPLLLLTGISSSVTASPQQLLLYEVLAHHLVQNCLCTPKTVPASTEASSPSSHSSPTQIAAPSQEYLRVNSTVREYASPPAMVPTRVSSPPRATNTVSALRRTASTNNSMSNSVNVHAGRLGGVMSAASRQLSFLVPLHVVHVMDDEEGARAKSAANRRRSLLWGYVMWRQSWESAADRRRLKHRNSFVCEAHDGGRTPTQPSSSVLQLQASSTQDTPAGTATTTANGSTRCTAEPHAFSSCPAPGRLLEWRRLREVRPASYSALPAPWEVFYEQLQRVNAGGDASLRCVPPVLSGAQDRVRLLRGCPGSLSSALLGAMEPPSTTTATSNAAWTPNCLLTASANGASTQAPLRQLASAMGVAASSLSGVNRRQKWDASRTERDVITQAVQRRHRSQRLAQRIEAAATTVAEEQVPPCAMPLYNAAEVRQSQQAALLSFARLEMQLATHMADNGAMTAALKDAAASSAATEVTRTASDSPACPEPTDGEEMGEAEVENSPEAAVWEGEAEVSNTPDDRAAETTSALPVTPPEHTNPAEAVIADKGAAEDAVDVTPRSPPEEETTETVERSSEAPVETAVTE